MPLLVTSDKLKSQPWYQSVQTIVRLCNQLRELQKQDGGFSAANAAAATEGIRQLIAELQPLHAFFAPSYMEALTTDLHGWLKQGLETRPTFDHSLRKFAQTENGAWGFALFPLRDLTQRTDHVRLEAFVYFRNELPLLTQMRRQYRDLRYQAVELLLATKGLSDNNVLNLFPEAVSVEQLDDQQQFALFFHNKYLELFFTISKPLGKFLVAEPLHVWQATADQIYDARTVYSYFHDLYHYSGTLPFDVFWRAKQGVLASCLEEIRVDTHTYLTLTKHTEEPCRLAAELFLLDRVYRYSYTDEPTDSFDCLTNYFFLAYLLRHRGVRFDNKQLYYDQQAIAASLSQLAGELEQLEEKLLLAPPHRIEELIAEWLSDYLILSPGQTVERTLFADWLIAEGRKRGIPRTIGWSAQTLCKYV